MLTIDPSQKKIVWVLMAILIGAICVTVIRIKPSGQAAPAATAEVATQATSKKGQAEVQVQNLSRNPFTAPDLFSMAQARSNAAELGLPIPGSKPKNGSGHAAGSGLGKLPLIEPVAVKMPNTNQTAGHNGTGQASNQVKPVFALLATIRSADGFSAVIKSSDSMVRVVNVGDVLEGGYKVRALQPGRAILSNGEDTIVASKPQS